MVISMVQVLNLNTVSSEMEDSPEIMSSSPDLRKKTSFLLQQQHQENEEELANPYPDRWLSKLGLRERRYCLQR
jgi:hypothetical protein